MHTPPYLQSVVAPICRYSETASGVCIEQLHGTGFLVANNGVFITARHVIDNALADIDKYRGGIGIFPTQYIDEKPTSLTVPIINHEMAPEPFDVAIFITSYWSETFFRLKNDPVEVWQDIATMGYPYSAAHKDLEHYEVQQRVHKGYIQRKIPSYRHKIGKHPDVFELSFPITQGLSGSPLFIYRGEYDVVIGVCVGSCQSSVVAYENSEYHNGHKTLHERTSRIEEFGIAHDIRPLLEWRPACLSGMSLIELSGQLS